jgi:hypothetical protein
VSLLGGFLRKTPLKSREAMVIKDRDLWIVARDQNTKFFQKIANYRKNYNTIWESG